MDHRNFPDNAPVSPEMLVSLIEEYADPNTRMRLFTLFENLSFFFIEYDATSEEEIIACIRKINAKLKKLFKSLIREDIWRFMEQQLPISTHPPGINDEEISMTRSETILHCIEVFKEARHVAGMDLYALNEFWEESTGLKTLRGVRSLSENYRRALDPAFIETDHPLKIW